MPNPQPGQEQRMERGDLRMICADAECVATPSMQREMGRQVWAHIGPIGEFVSHPELQEALGLVVMAFNRRHGRLSAEKHAEISKGHEAGAVLLNEATRPAASPGEYGELVNWLRRDADRQDATDESIVSTNAMRNAADRLETQAATIARLREGLLGIANAIRIGAESDVLAWSSLAEAMRREARAALSPNPTSP